VEHVFGVPCLVFFWLCDSKRRNTYGMHASCGPYLACTTLREGVWLGECKVFVSRHPSSALCKVEDAGYQKQVFRYFSGIEQARRLV
jgi:hypothetical protein